MPGAVARFEPFRALRYRPGLDLHRVTAPPYDVLAEGDLGRLRGSSEHNIVHIDVPAESGHSDHIDVPAENAHSNKYSVAGHLLRSWRDEGVLVLDEQPSLTIYRMTFDDRTGAHHDVVGVIGGLRVVDHGSGGVLPHERTTHKASTDRLDLIRATRTNTSPVWGLSLARGLTDLLRDPGDAMGQVDVTGVRHSVERVTDPDRIHAICSVIGSDDVLLADGHHRYGVARTYRDEIRSATGRSDTTAEHAMAFVGELVPDQLAIAAIHRLITGISFADLVRTLRRDFDLVAAPQPTPAIVDEMQRTGRLLLIGPHDQSHWLIPRPDAFDGLRALDGVWLEHTVHGTSARLGYEHDVSDVVRAVRSGAAQAAVLIRPTSIEEIERTAREHLLMPPKSTFFTPKLCTGLVLRPLDDAPGH